MEIERLEKSLTRVMKGEVSSLDAQAAMAGALLVIAKEISAIRHVINDRQAAQAPAQGSPPARVLRVADDEAV